MHEFISLKRSRASLPLLRLFSVVLIASLIILPAGALAAPDNAPESAPANAALTNKVIFLHLMVCARIWWINMQAKA